MGSYSDGRWHDWMGGERPVDPETLTDCVVLVEGDEPSRVTAPARIFDWQGANDPVVRFRAIKAQAAPSWRGWGIIRWLFQPAPLRCDACGRLPETTGMLVMDFPGGAICADREKCKAPSR